ncbi:uncharacterized protein LOC127009483 [Eriocheir sinensis]|uniref:uncharacterized protein LOC127009483 n=1 Tax=Eriocheir sinensis TaxID=95602 RepID=UPI0021C5A4C9|nr:uncharacterized protein LOC127009483 [Eriocheir sinensis]
MLLLLLTTIALSAGLTASQDLRYDVGCKNSYALGAYGKCLTLGCCSGSGQDSSPALCTAGGATETCCYRDDACGSVNCINVAATWVSRYAYSADYNSVYTGFTTLRQKGINRVYFNIWADGNLYANSATAQANGVTMAGDRLATAVSVAKELGLEIYAWLEYGTQACYGSLNGFATTAASKGWLLCHDPSSGCTDYFAGSYAYLDLGNSGAVDFLKNMVADIVRGYPGLDGFQFDDHFSLPNDFASVSSMAQSTRYSITRNAMISIRDAAQAARSSVHISFAPSPLDFARSNHNVDWANYLYDGVVMEVVPQYYRTTYSSFKTTLDADLARVSRYQNGLVAAIRLSGSGADTPWADVNSMLEYCYTVKLRGASFWFADDIISDASWNPPAFRFC